LNFNGFFFFLEFYHLFYPLRYPKMLILCGNGMSHNTLF
jgi:hypothetical protein